jgi:predicted Zn-dependent protease
MKLRRVMQASCTLALIFTNSCSGCTGTSPGDPGREGSVAPGLAVQPDEPSAYERELAKMDKQIGTLQKRALGREQDWLTRQFLASALLDRASLTGQVADYKRVERVLDETFAIGEVGTGPALVAARFDYAIHRLDKAYDRQRKLAGYSILKRDQLFAIVLLGAQIAFQRGQYAEALATLERLAAGGPSPAHTNLALYHAKTGRVVEAEKLFEQARAATEKDDAKQRAWLGLQLGIIAMESGRYDEALNRLKAADSEFSGWWLIREHIAEVLTLLGKDTEAVPIYEAVIAQTELPQYMDALAGCYERLGRQHDAEALVARARAAWKQQIAELPESAMGHGLEHYLEHGSAEEALDLAKKNHAARPNGEACVLLAKAYLKADNPKAALEVLEQTLATPYRSADLHDAAREAYTALGQAKLAAAQRSLCLAVNPRYYDAPGGSGSDTATSSPER